MTSLEYFNKPPFLHGVGSLQMLGPLLGVAFPALSDYINTSERA